MNVIIYSTKFVYDERHAIYVTKLWKYLVENNKHLYFSLVAVGLGERLS